MLDPDTHELPEREAAELVARLKALPRVSAPVGFADQLRARISQLADEETAAVPASRRLFARQRFAVIPVGYRRAVYTLGAVAVVAFIFVKTRPEPVPSTGDLASAAIPPAGSRVNQPVPPPATQTQISPAPGSRSRGGGESSVPVGGRRSDGGSAEHLQSATGRGVVATSSAPPLPPELLDRPHVRSTPIVGGTLSTASTGTPSISRQNDRVADSMQGLTAAPNAAAFMALQRGLDSTRIRDSIRKAQAKIRKR